MKKIEDKNRQELEEYIQNAEMQKSNLEKNLNLAKDRLGKIESNSIEFDELLDRVLWKMTERNIKPSALKR